MRDPNGKMNDLKMDDEESLRTETQSMQQQNFPNPLLQLLLSREKKELLREQNSNDIIQRLLTIIENNQQSQQQQQQNQTTKTKENNDIPKTAAAVLDDKCEIAINVNSKTNEGNFKTSTIDKGNQIDAASISTEMKHNISKSNDDSPSVIELMTCMKQIVQNQTVLMNRLDEMEQFHRRKEQQFDTKIEQSKCEIVKQFDDLREQFNKSIEHNKNEIMELHNKVDQNYGNTNGTMNCTHTHNDSVVPVSWEEPLVVSNREASTVDVDNDTMNCTHTHNDSVVPVSWEEPLVVSNKEESHVDLDVEDINSKITKMTKDPWYQKDPILDRMMKYVTMNDNIDTQTIPVRVIKNQSGKLLFVEAESNFVNLLDKVQQVPIGILSKMIENGKALHTLQTSYMALPEEHFIISKEKALVPKFLDPCSPQPILVSGGSMRYDGNGYGPFTCKPNVCKDCRSRHNDRPLYTIPTDRREFNGNDDSWEYGVAFSGLGDNFEMTLEVPSFEVYFNKPTVMLGILPDDCNLATRCTTKKVYESYGFFLSPDGATYPSTNGNYPQLFNGHGPQSQRELRMRFQRYPQKLEFRYNNGPWHEVEIKRGFGVDETTQCCPVILCNKQAYSFQVTNVKSLDNVLLKPNATFVLSNELEIRETNSISLQLDVCQRYNIMDLSTLQTTNVDFGMYELWKLISALLNGERDVLGHVFD